MSEDAPIKKSSSPKKSTKKASAPKKSSPFESADFMKELKDLFAQTPLIPSASEFMNAFKKLKMIPTKWTPNTIRTYLTEVGVILYSKTKPQGYSLNLTQLDDCIVHPPPLVEVTTESKENVLDATGESPTSDVSVPLESGITQEISQPSKKSSKKKKTLAPDLTSSTTTVNSDVKTSEVSSITSTPSISAKNLPSSGLIVNPDSPPSSNVSTPLSPPTEKTKETHVSSNLTEQQILERIPSIPRYLMERMSRDAQKFFMMGLLDINRLPSDKLERGIEYLGGARLFFDRAYENELEVLDFLDKKVAFMNRRNGELKDKEAEDKFRKNFMEPLLKGKFDKITRKIGPGCSIENAAWEIVEKMGRDARNIPLSEIALRRKIETILKERYDKK